MSKKFEINPTKWATGVGESSRLIVPQSSAAPEPSVGIEDRVGLIFYKSTSPSDPESNFTSIGVQGLSSQRHTLIGDETYTGTGDYRYPSSYDLAQLGLYCFRYSNINIYSDPDQYLATIKLYNIRTSGGIMNLNLVSYESWHEAQIPLGVPMSAYASSNPLVVMLNGQRTYMINEGTAYYDWMDLPTPDSDENSWLRNPTLSFANGGSTATVSLAPKKHPMSTEVSINNRDFLLDSSNVHILCFSYNGSPKLYAKIEFPYGSEHLFNSSWDYLQQLASAMNEAISNYRYGAGLPDMYSYIATDEFGTGDFVLRAITVNTGMEGSDGNNSLYMYDLTLTVSGRGKPTDILSDRPLLDGAYLMDVDSTLTLYPDISGHPFEIPSGWQQVSVALDTTYVGTAQPFNIHSRQRYWTPPQPLQQP